MTKLVYICNDVPLRKKCLLSSRVVFQELYPLDLYIRYKEFGDNVCNKVKEELSEKLYLPSKIV